MVNWSDDFAEREKELLRRIGLAEKHKKDIIDKTQELLAQFMDKEISDSEYRDKLNKILQGKDLEEWLDYYDNYTKYCENYLDICRKDIRKERAKIVVLKVAPFVFLGLLIAGILGVLFFGFVAEVPVSLAPTEVTPEVLPEIPGITKVEQEIPRGKRVIVTGPPTGLENVLISTEIPENWNIINKNNLRLRWYQDSVDVYVEHEFEVFDTNNNGKIDRIEWVIPSLGSEEQTFDIILITKAEHLDSNRKFISDIFKEVRELDNIWSETIPSDDFVRVTFERPLTNENDITVFPRTISGNPRIEVYEVDGNEIIAEFTSINDNEYNKVLLTNLVGSQDTFDLRIVDGDIEIDHIIDPLGGPILIDGCDLTDITTVLNEENATYQLIDDVNFDAALLFICFEVTAKNITLDGQGHSVVRTDIFKLGDTFDGLGIDLNSQNFTLKNINFLNGPGGNIDPGIDGSGGPAGGSVRPGQPLTIINSTLEELVDINRGSSTGGDAIIINSTVGSIDAHGNLCKPPQIGCSGHTQNKLDIINSNITKEILIYGGFSGPGGNITMISDFIYMDNLVINATGYDDLIRDHPPGTLTINYTEGFTDIDASYSEKINLRIVNRSNAGEIFWFSENNTGAINSSSLTNLSIHTEIHHNFAFVDGIALPDLDRTALISLYGFPALGFTNPVILRDGVECVGCVLFTSINAETVIFNVTGFSSYSIGGGSPEDVHPLIAFVPPTPANGSTQANTDIYVNVSSSDDNGHYTFVDFDSDLFLWLRMDDASGNTVIDLSSYSNNGTLNGDAFINSTGYWGNASHYDGINDATDDYIGVPSLTASVFFNDSFSVSVWINRNIDDGAVEDILGTESSINSQPGWKLQVTGANQLRFIGNNGTREDAIGHTLNIGEWTHVVGVYNQSTPSLQIYINGTLIHTATTTASTSGYGNGQEFRIGATDSFARIWDGSIDEVILFNRSLTATEISALFNASANQYFNNFTGLADGTHEFTGYAVDLAGNKNQTEDRMVTIEATANNPVIVDISDLGLQSIEIGGLKYINFSVIVSDADGFGDIDTVNASFNPPFELITRSNSSCVFVNSIDSITANYSCTVDIWYFDEPGQWNVTVTANDTQNLQSDYYFENFVLGETVAFVQYPLGPDGFTWPPLIPGAQDILANEIMLINNTGNANVSLGGIHINATNLIGQIDNNYLIPAENFSINTINFCGGTPMSNGENVTIPDALLPRGNNSINNLDETSGQEVLYICIEQVPIGLLDQDYGPAPWDINFNTLIAGLLTSIFAVPLAIARAKKRKKRKLKELSKALSDEDLLEILGEKLVEFLDVVKENKLKIKEKEDGIPISVFRRDMSPAEALTKYLKENKGMRFNEIAKLINRDQRTLWTNYKNASKKKKEKIVIGKEKIISIPIKVFGDRRLSILESIVKYLKEKGLRNFEIADMLGKDQKNIWTLYSRANKKLGIKNKS